MQRFDAAPTTEAPIDKKQPLIQAAEDMSINN